MGANREDFRFFRIEFGFKVSANICRRYPGVPPRSWHSKTRARGGLLFAPRPRASALDPAGRALAIAVRFDARTRAGNSGQRVAPGPFLTVAESGDIF